MKKPVGFVAREVGGKVLGGWVMSWSKKREKEWKGVC